MHFVLVQIPLLYWLMETDQMDVRGNHTQNDTVQNNSAKTKNLKKSPAGWQSGQVATVIIT